MIPFYGKPSWTFPEWLRIYFNIYPCKGLEYNQSLIFFTVIWKEVGRSKSVPMVEDRLSTRITIKFNQCNYSVKICELSQSLLLFPFCSSKKKNLPSFLPLFHLRFCILFTKLVVCILFTDAGYPSLSNRGVHPQVSYPTFPN